MANKIKILNEQVANQIAAGEVVDRPASIVKELVENSLDAGAGRVLVEVEQGGKRLVRVVDDGEGMSREDALLALERHATSKIKESRDLFSIHTFGFRGEALPSIASVSDLDLVTRTADQDEATVIRMSGGKIKDVTRAGAPVGTEIAIRRLFHSVPARRKFMKTVETEFGHIAALLGNMALARPDAHFTLTHNGRDYFDLPASTGLAGRLRHALGADAVGNLVPVDSVFRLETGDLRVHGYVSVPSYQRSSTRSLHLFVNRRFVRDRLINHAVFEAYRPLIPKGKYPLVVLFVDLPAEAVDVNVHPAKHEIRFREQAQVHEAVVRALNGALRRADRGGAPAGWKTSPAPAGADQAAVSDLTARQGAENALERFHRKMEAESEKWSSGQQRDFRAGLSRAEPASCASTASPEPPFVADKVGGEDLVSTAVTPLSFSELRVIGQLAGTFILAESPDSFVIIDQHAAHEKIRYEALSREYATDRVACQSLLFPVTLELSHQEARRVEANREALLRFGLEVEPFSGNTVAVKGLPAILGDVDPRKILLAVVDGLGEGRDPVEGKVSEVLAVMACHSVVRANKPMSIEEMRALLAAMDRADFPGHCPHGREVVVRIKVAELARWFGR